MQYIMIAEILNFIPQELIGHTPQADVIAPSFAELSELAKVDNVTLHVLVVKENTRVVACAACYIQRRRHHGLTLSIYELFGYLLHDYSRIYAESEAALNELLKLAEYDAKNQKCDLIYWDNIPKELVCSDVFQQKSEIKIFSSKEAEDGWKELYNRKSVKRFRNKASRVAPYRVEVIDGYVPRTLMEQLSKLHIERWRFAGASSPFESNLNRIEEYTTYAENKHYLRVLLGDEILACHYGMKYGSTLLWHTPVINPKYLALSPLRLLLGETAKYCEEKGLKAIDFGLGDEAYKNGYCTLPRVTCRYEKTFTLKAEIANIIRTLSSNEDLVRFANKAINILKGFKEWIHRDAIVKYSSNSTTGEHTEDDRFYCISTWTEFYDFCLTRNYPIHTWQYDRFLRDETSEFLAYADDRTIFCAGWASSKSPFPIGENNSIEDLEGKVCIYDFVTPLDHRQKGYYTKLLKATRSYYDKTFIYAKKNNKASRKAIERSGFKRIY